MHKGNGVLSAALALALAVVLSACGGGAALEDGTPIGETATDASIGFARATDHGWTMGSDGFIYTADAAYPVDFENERAEAVTVQLFLAEDDHPRGAPPTDPSSVVATVEVGPGDTVTEIVPLLQAGDYLMHVDPVGPDEIGSYGGLLSMSDPDQ